MSGSDPDHTPVLVGIGVATRREEDFGRALEPMDLMLEAVRAAGADTGSAATLAGVQYVAVPRGRWRYRNPAGEIARAVGAKARTVLATVGVLQQTLIGEACARIARGEAHTTLVAGADAGYRILRAQIAGRRASERDQDDEPDETLAPEDELRHPAEVRAGFRMPVGLYALMDSAHRARLRRTVATHRDRLAALGARFSAIAAENPHAWNRRAVAAEAIREAGERNPMQAFPYTRYHCSTWNVDQAGALLFCSAARAAALGIPRAKWIHPRASTESNFMSAVAERDDIARCPGARIAGMAALEASGYAADRIDLVELYSCFPIAVETYAEALGLSLDRDLTVTGGMPFAGGPYNNYVLQSTARMAELLRAGAGRSGLVSSVSGVLTKQGFGVYSVQPPERAFEHVDVSAAVERGERRRVVHEDYTGPAGVIGHTVLYGRGTPARGVALVDAPDGSRALATTADPALVARLEAEDWIGRAVRVEGNALFEPE